MKRSCLVPVFRTLCISLVFTLSADFAHGDPDVLRWNGSPGAVWDAATANWRDAEENPVAWQPGASAVFDGAGGLVAVAADVVADTLTFAANGYTLIGAGRLTVEGALTAAAGTTNSIAAEVIAVSGLAKTGAGAIALARCTGPLAVQEGVLLVAGSLFADADLSVAAGASVVTLGEPDTAANLILNPGFEIPAMGNGSWNYVASANLISNWTAVTLPQHVGRQNTAASGSPWNSVGSSPEGSHMLILQYHGAVAQTVTVPADGLYSFAFSHLLRNGYADNQVYVTLNGLPLAAFLNRSVQFSPGRFCSGALWLAAGSYTFGIGGEGNWGDRASMIDAVCLAPPSVAAACRALGGDSLLKAVPGASVVLAHSGTVPLAYVALDGTAAAGTFNASHASGIFSGSGALSCAAPANVFAWSGSGLWSETARWADGAAPAAGGSADLLVNFSAADGATAQNDLDGLFLSRRLAISGLPADGTFTLSGNAIALTNSANGAAPKISVAAPGAVAVSAPVTARAALTIDTLGSLTLTADALSLPNGSTFYKSGDGLLTLPTLTNTIANAFVYEGTVQTPGLPSSAAIWLLSRSGKSPALYLTQGGVTVGNTVNLAGSDTVTLGTRCGGGTVTLSNWTYGYGSSAVFDVGADDTLSLRQMLSAYLSSGSIISATTLTKTGPGILDIRSGGQDTGNNRAYRGNTVLRSGTIRLLEDDWGTLGGWTNPFNGRTYSATGGSLGYNALTNAVTVGDALTDPSGHLALIAAGNGRWIGRPLDIFNRGASVTLGMTAGTAMFAGTVTLHRDIILSGPADGTLVFSNVVAAAGYAGTGAHQLSGLAGLIVEGALPAETSLVMDGRRLRFGTYTVRSQTLNALVLGSAAVPGTLDVDFAAGANDLIAVTAADGLTLSNTVVNLTYAGSGLPFAEPGTYTLFTYAGTLGGDTALLTVGNPQSGAGYAFADDAENHRVTLTISNTSGGSAVVWKHASGGAWADGANWDTGSAPGGAGVSPLFGLAITEPAAVALGGSRTVGALTFNNPSHGYTLSGGTLTFDDNGPTPLVSVLSGTHILDATLAGADGLAVSTASGASLILGTNAVVATGLSLAQGTVELRGNATVTGPADLDAATLLRVAATNAAVGALTGEPTATLALTGTVPRLAVTQDAAGLFAGVLTGTSGTFVKGGAQTLTLDNPLSAFSGGTVLDAGTLALKTAALAGPVAVGGSATLAAQPPAVSGLMGYYYSVTPNTNNFWTLAGMEAHLASLKPDLAALSGLAGAAFDFTTSGPLFPQPYGAGGSRTENFEVVYRGTLTVPESGLYVFGLQADDGVILAIDGKTLVARNRNVSGWSDASIRLDAGRHDIIVGYFQLTGGSGLQMRVRRPSDTDFALVPNAWLAPYAAVGTLSGAGTVALPASNALLRVTQSDIGALVGTFSGDPGAQLAKSGSGVLALATGGAFPGGIDVQSGTLALATDNALAAGAPLHVRADATLAVTAAADAGTLSGEGSLRIGGHVYAQPFTGDADSDISAAKTYTHTLDFPSGTADAVVNGVTFHSSGMSGSRNGYGWSVTAGNPPGGAWNTAPADNTRTGVDSLLWDFQYGSPDFTFTLTGLTPGKMYETRFYFRNFASNPRNLTFTFTAGAADAGAVSHNPDSVARSWVGCRYLADASGTLSVRVVSQETAHSAHIYGLSNEEVAGASAPALTLTPAAGRSARFTGAVFGGGGLVKAGAGTQRFGGSSTLAQRLHVASGAVVFEPGAAVTAGVSIAAGALAEVPHGSVTLGGLSGTGTLSLGSTPTNTAPYFVAITGDADSGISPHKAYTHLLDFGNNGNRAVVNGVGFNKVGAVSGAINSYGWTGIPGSVHGGSNGGNIGVPTSQGIYNLLYDMNYGARTTTVQLTGLTIGKAYEVRIYNRRWETNEKNRTQTFIFDSDGNGPLSDSVTFNPDSALVKPNDNYLGYRYVAGTNYLAVTIQSHTADTYHLYGLSNEETFDAQANPVILAVGGNDVFEGAVTGSGAWAKTGPGTLTLAGESTAIGPLAVQSGAFGVGAGGTATLGPVTVAAGATLFGDGRVGGTVAVASNAWLAAGTPAAHGVLHVGTDLALAPGAKPLWRFSAAARDAFTVGGRLTFPAAGVLYAQAFTPGTRPPAKVPLFTSAQVIDGPAELTGWTVDGLENARLVYSADLKTIYFSYPSGTVISIR